MNEVKTAAEIVGAFFRFLADKSTELTRERVADIDLELLKLRRREIDERFEECRADVGKSIADQKSKKLFQKPLRSPFVFVTEFRGRV